MVSAFPIRVSLADQFQKRLIDQCGGLQCVIDPLSLQVTRGLFMKLVINKRHQLFERFPVSALPFAEHCGYRA